MKAGEELTLDYEYDLNNCPEWFKTAFNSYVEDKDNADKIQNLSPKYLSYMENSWYQCYASSLAIEINIMY